MFGDKGRAAWELAEGSVSKALPQCHPQKCQVFKAGFDGFNSNGLPSRQLTARLQLERAPRSYWLIENRASFERQSQKLARGVCLVSLPGRPSEACLDWQATHMDSSDRQNGVTLPLNDYKRRVLVELDSEARLPPSLTSLRDYMRTTDTKAEQEGRL